MSKSSTLNLYDAVSGERHFQVKTFSDKVDFSSSTLPINLKGHKVNLHNLDGQVVYDVVSTILAQIQASTQEVNDRMSAVSSEAASRISGDAAVQANVDQEVSDRQAAVSAEVSARTSADTTLQANIDSEVAARGAAVLAERDARSGADATLQFNLDTEASDRKSGDANLQANIDQEVSDRTAAVSAEETARSSADTALQINIDNEESTRSSADATLQTNIEAEVSARIAAVDAEATARTSADESLAAQITAEQTARLAEVAVERSRIDAILQGTSIDLNQLQELINAYTTSDQNILAQINNLTANITAVQTQLNVTDERLNTLLADVSISSGIPVLIEIFTTANGLTDMSLVTHSSSYSANDAGYFAFNGIYGADVEYYGWTSHGGEYRQSLTIDSVSELGHYVYVDLSTVESSDPIKAFELWAHGSFNKPRDFYIVGSSDGVNFTKLYDNSGVNVLTNETTAAAAPKPLGGTGTDTRLYSDVITMSNSTVYQYIGIFVKTSFGVDFNTPQNSTAPVWVQELRLFK